MQTSPIYKPTVGDILKTTLVMCGILAIAEIVGAYHSYSEMLTYQFSNQYYTAPSFTSYISPYLFLIAFVGLLFFLVLFFYTKLREKKTIHLRTEIEKVRDIVCDGMASYVNGGLNTGGWLFLSMDALEFYPSKDNISHDCIAVLLDDIEQIEAHSKTLIVHTKAENIKFKVYKASLWKKQITKIL